MRRRDFLKTSTVAVGASLLEGCRGGPEEQFIVQLPVRPALQGESIWSPSVCQQCTAGCGILVRVVDGNAKKIEGNPDHPVGRGGACALGQSLLQELYNPDRILSPLRATGERGAGSHESVTWEEALAQVVDALGTAGQNVAFVGGDSRGFTGALLRRLAAALGAPPPSFLEAPELEVERAAARVALGVDEVPYYDLSRADFVLSIGAPIVDRWRSPVHYTWALAEMRRGRVGRRGRLVQAESRMSLSAANADEWLPVRPGTEGTFARGIAGVLLAEGAVGAAGRERYAQLFPGPAPSVEEVAEVCGVRADRLQSVALDLAAAENRLVVGGGSAAGHTNGLFNVVAALALNLLLDNLGQPGGVFAPVGFGLAEGLAPADAAPVPLSEVAARLRGDSAPSVDVLVVAEADLLQSTPAGWGMEAALADVDTVVALSGFMDETTLFADLVLPLSTEPERFNADEPATSVGVRTLSIAQPVVDPMGETNHPADVILAISAAMGGPVAEQLPWTGLEALVRARIEEEQATLPGGAEADALTYYFGAIGAGGIFEEGPPSGVPPGPSGPAPQEVDASADGDPGAFPFQLIPHASLKVDHGRGSNRPWLQELPDPMSTVMWNSWVEVSPVDAEDLGIHDGDRVRIESETGAVEVSAVIDPAVRPGLIGMPMGHGHRDYGRYAQSRGANPMHLVGSLQVDGTGAPAWASTRVRIAWIGPAPLARFGGAYEAEEEAGEAGTSGEESPVASVSQEAGRGAGA